MADYFMPLFFSKVIGLFRAVEIRSPQDRIKFKMPLNIMYTREADGRPSLLSIPLGASNLVSMNILEQDPTFKAEFNAAYGSGAYRLRDNLFRLVGVSPEYYKYPRNVFFCACVLTPTSVELADFCVNLLAQIEMINYTAAPLPSELSQVMPEGRWAYDYERDDSSVILNIGSRNVAKVKNASLLMNEEKDKIKIHLGKVSP